MRLLLAPLAILSAALLLAWWLLHLAISLDALARQQQFSPPAVRRCGIDRDWYGGYVERCGPW